MWIAVAVVAVVATALTVRAHMHMLQLNSYRARVQWPWLRHHVGWWLLQLAVLVVAALSLIVPLTAQIGLLVLLLAAGWASWPSRTHAKKPLVTTARVKRMYVTIAVLVAALIVLGVVVPGRWHVLIASLPYVLSPLWVVIANGINTPIEAGVRRRYLNDAKRMLASQPKLVKIGITGSFGKTSVKYYLATLLKSHFDVLMTPGSYNTPMGITRTIREQLRATHQVFIAEMGARHVGDIKEDCDLVEPSIGVITAIGEQHLETFGSQANIIRTKLELADAVRGQGTLYLNGDNELLAANAPAQDTVTYGLGTGNDVFAYDITVSTSGTTFSLSYKGHTITGLTTPLIGAAAIQNLAGAAAVALDLGVSEDELRGAIRKLAPAPHRLSMTRQGAFTIIDDAYNSNPAGAKAALDTLAMFDATKILITPGMVELGVRQDALNEEFGAQAVIADHVYLVGAKQTEPIARGLLGAGYDSAKLTVLDDVQDAIRQAYALPGDGDRVILLENDLPDNY